MRQHAFEKPAPAEAAGQSLVPNSSAEAERRTRRMTPTLVRSCLIAVLLIGCDGLWLDTYWRSEKYVLLAVDARGQMALYVDQGNGMASGLVDPTVFSIGWDERYIVVKQHPNNFFGSSLDRSITHYFIVTKTASPELTEREKGVRGPLTQEEFARLATTLSLPKFSKTFADLQ